jgi:hypothetical protein
MPRDCSRVYTYLEPEEVPVDTNLNSYPLIRNTHPAAAAPAPSGASKPASGPAPEKRYTVTISVNIQNLLNTTNPAQPIGNLSSPQFGESISTAGGFGFGPSGSAAAGNRRIQVQIRFGFLASF